MTNFVLNVDELKFKLAVGLSEKIGTEGIVFGYEQCPNCKAGDEIELRVDGQKFVATVFRIDMPSYLLPPEIQEKIEKEISNLLEKAGLEDCKDDKENLSRDDWLIILKDIHPI